ncbi:MAG: FtsW/RodA/SpoVE family cell cycle protein [Oscillospiraceae bacterium]|jgi:rod shape determining protein RodA|nr:FtsW/RodA/SpoVE family cell cycle protein [Oscillospiraceae bacterium]
MNESRLKTTLKETNLPLFLLCLAISAFGTITVVSATMHLNAPGQLLSRDATVMLAAIGLGIVLSFIISLLDYEVMLRQWFVIGIFIFCVGFMLSLKTPIGVAPPGRPDSQLWIKIGGIFFQPSELVKIGFIMAISAHITTLGKEINRPAKLALLLVHGAVYIGLVTLTGDMGSALVFVAIFGGLLFIAGIKWYYFLAAVMLVCAALPLVWLKVFSPIQKERFIAVYPRFFAAIGETLSPERFDAVIYQQQMGVNAISGGGLLGQGLFNGEYTQSSTVPISESDMVFSVVGEEMGFVGVAGLLALLAAIIIVCMLSGHKSNEESGKLICGGVALMLGVQAVINIGMCMKFLPCIGITLPFISSGGSSNLCVWLGIGLVMSVSRHSWDHGPSRVRFIKKY